jgi:hypothetical protein
MYRASATACLIAAVFTAELGVKFTAKPDFMREFGETESLYEVASHLYAIFWWSDNSRNKEFDN